MAGYLTRRIKLVRGKLKSLSAPFFIDKIFFNEYNLGAGNGENAGNGKEEFYV